MWKADECARRRDRSLQPAAATDGVGAADCPLLPDAAASGAGWLRARRDASAHQARLRTVLMQIMSLLGEVRCIPGRLQDEVQVNLLVPAAETHPVLHELRERLRVGDALWSACTVTGPWPPYAFISWETA